MITSNTYLNFPGNCKEALSYYAKVMGAEITALMTARNTPMEAHCTPDMLDKVMHARLKIGDVVIMASDAPATHYQAPQGFSVNVSVDTPDQADQIYAALSEGGRQTMPIAETFWAKRFGMCVDRFGTPWMINCEKEMDHG